MEPVYMHLSKPSGLLPEGVSRFWGAPDLPSGCRYPCYMDDAGDEYPYFFVCQINLGEFAPYDVGSILPHEGMLYFFAKIDCYAGYGDATECIGGSISGSDAVRVVYSPSCEGLKEVALEDGHLFPCFPGPLRIHFSHEPGELLDEHAVFASPVHRPWETWDPPFEDWMILLQVDSFEGEDFSLNFMDTGVLDFLISPHDLEKSDFSDVRAIVLSS